MARQKELGVVPADAELTARPDKHPGAETIRRRSSRCSLGRWRCTPVSSSTPITTSAASSSALGELGIVDDTLVYYVIGDNGASAEAHPTAASTS